MSSSLFGYYGIGLRALNAARLGLQVAGDNIANASTPGYARRRADFSSGFPIRVQGGMLDQGPEVSTIRRLEDRFVQSTLEREQGTLGYSRERLRGLNQIESTFGDLQAGGLLGAYGEFSNSFAELSAYPENVALRRTALGAADRLATEFRGTFDRLTAQRRTEDQAIAAQVGQVNDLAGQLADLNRRINQEEADGSVAAPLRDQRQLVVERLGELTGGAASPAEDGRILFALPGGPTLVTSERAVALTTSADAQGYLRINAGGNIDVTDTLRSGSLGARIELRDETLTDQLDDLNLLAEDLITRANQLTQVARDLNGGLGGPLFEPNPPGADPAGAIVVSSILIDDPRKLALSRSGAPGDGVGALDISRIQTSGSTATLGGSTPTAFLSDGLTALGNEIIQADVAAEVSRGVVGTLEARREAVSGVSLDEEAVELIRHQRAFEAAARFMQVLNEITEVAVNLG